MKKNKFVIPQIKEQEKKESSTFVSPFFGATNKDEIVVPKDPMKGNIKDRYKDYAPEQSKKDKDELKKEFSLLEADEIRSMIEKKPHRTDNDDNYIKVSEPKPEPKVEQKEVDLHIPFGLEVEPEPSNEPISEAELNEVLGDYEGSIFIDEIEIPEEGPEPTEEEKQLQESLHEWFEIDKEDSIPGDRMELDTTASKSEELDRSLVEEEPIIITEVKEETVVPKEVVVPNNQKYLYPPMHLLHHSNEQMDLDEDDILEQEEIINNTLSQFRVGGKVVNYTHGPTVTQFEVKLDQGVMINKVTNIANNLKMNLAAIDIRIEAPIPGKPTVGIEVPNKNRKIVYFGDLIDQNFIDNSKELDVIIGVNLAGETIQTNIAKMPHGLIAGATGSGKSVCIDTILISLLMKSHPDKVKLLLIDPKRVGLATYSQVPHLAAPIIYDAKVAAQALKWLVDEMERRYDMMHSVQARDIDGYNAKIVDRLDEGYQYAPKIVLIIEEMADLMAQAASDVEMSIHRLAQKARAAGIHMIIATQRPSTDIIKGSMKANIPTRIALQVSSYTDSMTIIDYGGAESLLGNGDMLMSFQGLPLQRLQGAFVSEKEIDGLTDYLSHFSQDFIFETETLELRAEKAGVLAEFDDLFLQVAEYVIETQYASINKIQKQFNIGYNRASDIFEQLTEEGIVSSPTSTTPRKVLMNVEQFQARYHS